MHLQDTRRGWRLDRVRSLRGALERRQGPAQLGLESVGERAFVPGFGAWPEKVLPDAIRISGRVFRNRKGIDGGGQSGNSRGAGDGGRGEYGRLRRAEFRARP